MGPQRSGVCPSRSLLPASHAAQSDVYAPEQLTRVHRQEQIVIRPGAESEQLVQLIELVAGDEDGGRITFAPQLAAEFQPVHQWQRLFEQQQRGVMLVSELSRNAPIVGAQNRIPLSLEQ